MDQNILDRFWLFLSKNMLNFSQLNFRFFDKECKIIRLFFTLVLETRIRTQLSNYLFDFLCFEDEFLLLLYKQEQYSKLLLPFSLIRHN